jgi:hypothetical protein
LPASRQSESPFPHSAKLEAERDRFVAAIRIGGGKLETLVKELADCEARLDALRRELEVCERPPLDDLTDRRWGRELKEHVQH